MANEIVLYQPNEQMSLEVKLENETVWLTLNQMASLFGRDKSVISRHIKAIFQERELTYEGSVAKMQQFKQKEIDKLFVMWSSTT